MGAWFDTRSAVGKDAKSAFRTMVEQTAWEEGHGGYTGSMAEKHDFVMVELPARMTARKFIDLVTEMQETQDTEWLRETVRDGERALRLAQGRTAKANARKWLVRDQKALKAAERAQARLAKKIPAHAMRAVKVAAETSDDKWGPAVGIELRGVEATSVKKRHGVGGTRQRAFLFFGNCSS